MVTNTAFNKLLAGAKVRATSWEKSKYISMNIKDGVTVDNAGKSFNMMATTEKKWELYKEPAKSVNADNSELLAIINKLVNKVDTLEETIKDQNQDITVESDVNSSDIADEVAGSISGEVEKAIKENMPQEERSHEETVKIFYGVSSLKDVRELFKTELLNCNDKKEVMVTVSKFIPYCWMGGRKIKTVARYYADMRNIIKDVADDYQDLALDLFSVPADVYDRIKQADTKKVLEKLDNQDEFDMDNIKGIISTLKSHIENAISLGADATIEDFKNNSIPVGKQQTIQQARAYLYASYFALVTGRRNTEILKTLQIEKRKDAYYFTGLTKSDKKELEAFTLENDMDFLVEVLNQIRADLDTTKLKNTEVNSKYNHIFNRSFKRLTGTTFTFHDARELYAEIMYMENGNIKGTDREEEDYKASILGHEIDKERLISTNHYMTKKAK